MNEFKELSAVDDKRKGNNNNNNVRDFDCFIRLNMRRRVCSCLPLKNNIMWSD